MLREKQQLPDVQEQKDPRLG